MKPTVISAEALFEAHRDSLRWEWIAGHAHPERRFDEVAVRDAQSAADLVGYLNYIHPYRVQIVGRREVRYLSDAVVEDQERRISRIVTLEPPVIVVADGQTAMSRAKEHLPELIFADLSIVGMGGQALCSALKEQPETSGIPFIVVSGDRDVAEKARSCGADDYMGKPFEFDDLVRLVKKYARTQG